MSGTNPGRRPRRRKTSFCYGITAQKIYFVSIVPSCDFCVLPGSEIIFFLFYCLNFICLPPLLVNKVDQRRWRDGVTEWRNSDPHTLKQNTEPDSDLCRVCTDICRIFLWAGITSCPVIFLVITILDVLPAWSLQVPVTHTECAKKVSCCIASCNFVSYAPV